MIFTDLAQRVRFAFQLAQYPGESANPRARMAAVRAALAGIGLKLPTGEATEDALEALRVDGGVMLDQVLALPLYERAALIAVHSKDWESKRLAASTLIRYFGPLLARLLDDARLVDRLVKRHYIARRDRGSGWSQGDIAEEFRIGTERLARAIAEVDHRAKELEHAAMQTLQARITEQESARA